MLKRIIAVLLGVVMVLSLGACGVKQKISDKIAEKVTEGVMEKAAGGKADIDLDKGKLTIKGENGEKFSIGESEWPKDGAAKLIPEFKKGKITSTVNAGEGCMIIIEEVGEVDFKQYVEQLKGKGFTKNVSELSSDSGLTYIGGLDEKTNAAIMYSSEQKNLTITVQINK